MTIDLHNLSSFFPFDTPRTNQHEIIQEIINAFEKHPYVILNAPTGVGKSPIAVTIANFFEGLSAIITSEKILQDQYTDDFSKLPNIVSVKGVSSYICPEDNMPVSEALCKIFGMKNCPTNCEYKQMLKKRNQKIWITNYSIALTNQYFIEKRQHEVIVFDEMHKLESVLLNNITCSLNLEFFNYISKRLEKINKDCNKSLSNSKILDLYSQATTIENTEDTKAYFDIFCEVSNNLLLLINEIKVLMAQNFSDLKDKKSTGLNQDDVFRFKALRYCWNTALILENAYNKFEILNEHIDNKKAHWIIEVLKDEIIFKPVYANFLFKPVLGGLSKKFLFMSATAHCKKMFCADFDINPDEVYEISIDSPFPIENRKIYVVNYLSMSYTNIKNNLQPMVECMDGILETITCRSMVHTGNYTIAKYIADNSKFKNRIVAPKSGEREFLIETEYKKKSNGILVSPSIIEGVSLNDDLCRVQIVVKTPYTSLADKRIKIKATQNPLWYNQEAIFKIVQSCGRSVRHDKDYCITFILDSGFANLYFKYPFLIPKWFLNAIEYIKEEDIIPKLQSFMNKNNIELDLPF